MENDCFELELRTDYGQENTFQIQPVPGDELANACFALQVSRECSRVWDVLEHEGVNVDTLDKTVNSIKLLVEFCTDRRLKGLNFEQKVRPVTHTIPHIYTLRFQNKIPAQHIT